LTEQGLIVLVTTEVFPFTSGGIGRLTYNILKTMSAEDRQRTVVILTTGTVGQAAFSEVFGGCGLLELDSYDFSACDPHLAWAVQGPGSWLATSVKLLIMLQGLSRTERIDYVEFPDWSGYGFATIQQKRLTGFLSDATIAVRLHSTEAMLVLFESRLLATQDLVRYDLERICLKDCDRIIGHLHPVAEVTRRVFGIDPASWERRLVIADAPVILNGQKRATQSAIPSQAQRIVFSSKLQEIKRPEIFVRGAARFLETAPGYAGTINFACPIINNAYARAVLDAVPETERDRFILPRPLSVKERDQLVEGSIVVFPTVFESYCLAAYEAAALGAVVVANHNNPAFGPDTPWKDGVNCITFDGSVGGLSEALQRCVKIDWPLAVAEPPVAPPAWHFPPTVSAVTAASQEKGGLAVVVVNQSEGAALQATLASLFSAGPLIAEIVVVDDGSSDTESDLVLADLEHADLPQVTVIRLEVAHGYASALNMAMRAVEAPIVAVLRSGTIVQPGYLRDAAACLARDQGIGIVCGQVRTYSDTDQLADGLGMMIPILGDGSISGNDANTYAEFGLVVRTELARRIGFRWETGYLCDWAFVRAAVALGVGIVVSPAEAIGRRAQTERDFGTPIDEFDRLRHIAISHIHTPALQAPIMQLAMACFRVPRGSAGQQLPDWYVHMLHHQYEPEVAFMAEFFGHTRLGRFIRSNTRFSAFMERLVNWLSRLGPRGAK
jgi:glycosyltransferase involved in cell wall biosynthesis